MGLWTPSAGDGPERRPSAARVSLVIRSRGQRHRQKYRHPENLTVFCMEYERMKSRGKPSPYSVSCFRLGILAIRLRGTSIFILNVAWCSGPGVGILGDMHTSEAGGLTHRAKRGRHGWPTSYTIHPSASYYLIHDSN